MKQRLLMPLARVLAYLFDRQQLRKLAIMMQEWRKEIEADRRLGI